MTITREEYDRLSPEEKSRVARKMTQKEWDKLFPPRNYDSDPLDASGWTGE